MPNLSLDDVEALARTTLKDAGATDAAASAVARSTRLAERDGIRSHGLLYVPIYAEHLVCGKVSKTAAPAVAQTRPGAIRVDADNGFAHTAIDAGWDAFTAAARARDARRDPRGGPLGREPQHRGEPLCRHQWRPPGHGAVFHRD